MSAPHATAFEYPTGRWGPKKTWSVVGRPSCGVKICVNVCMKVNACMKIRSSRVPLRRVNHWKDLSKENSSTRHGRIVHDVWGAFAPLF